MTLLKDPLFGNSADPTNRINNGQLLHKLIVDAARHFNLGQVHRFDVTATGYDDCNIAVTTHAGAYYLKIFSKHRTKSDVERYVQVLERVDASPVLSPTLRLAEGRPDYFHSPSNNRLIVTEALIGRSFYDLSRPPNWTETRQVCRQLTSLHRLDMGVTARSDWWDLSNTTYMYEKYSHLFTVSDRELIEKALRGTHVSTVDLPMRWCHGDLSQTNVFAMGDETIALIDFAGVNRRPRLQDFAMIVVNLLANASGDIYDLASRLCEQIAAHDAPLTDDEWEALPSVLRQTAVMELLGGLTERHTKQNHRQENDWLVDLGRKQLTRLV